MPYRVECVVIGAGVVGLAVARSLALRGRDVLVLERHRAIGTETSARNSEVVHAGIYYSPGSLKARFCVEGKQRLYAFCDTHKVAYRCCGKLIVATTAAQVAELHALERRARANGVDDLRFLGGQQVQQLEPQLVCQAALLSPSSGILDSHGFMLALQGDLERAGATVALDSPVIAVDCASDRHRLRVGGSEPAELLADHVVNCAGLAATRLARNFNGLSPDTIPRQYLARGNYFTLPGKSPFSHLVYPVPEDGGLGIHLTLDLAGQSRFGPDVEWVDQEDYRVDPGALARFAAAVKTYWPTLPAEKLQPGYAGIRPKLAGPGQPAADFMVQGPGDHGVRGLVNLYGIESPGLTASLALAEYVARLLH